MSKFEINDPEFIKRLANAFDAGDFQSILDDLRSLHPADQANLFSDLNPAQKNSLFQHLEISEIADIFDELNDEETLEASKNLSLPFLAGIIDDMDPDQAADLLGDLSGQDLRKTLSLLEGPEEILPLLRFPDETAGGLMTTNFLVLSPDDTADTALQYLRSSAGDTDIPYYLFVVSNQQELLGVTGLRELVRAEPEQPIVNFMNTQVASVHTMEDQEAAAGVMKHYDLQALPVVN